MGNDATLRIRGLVAGYGAAAVLRGLDLDAAPGQITVIMGRNGAGKTTLLRAIMASIRLEAGEISLGGQPIQGTPAHQIARHGIAWVPQGRRLFKGLSVAENLAVGALHTPDAARAIAEVHALFPRLHERADQPAETLSGGEQQMLAIGRALVLRPRVILLDEPGEGLQPSMVTLIQQAILGMKAAGTTVVLVEQRVEAALRLGDRIAFMSHGRIAESHATSDLGRTHAAFGLHVGV